MRTATFVSANYGSLRYFKDLEISICYFSDESFFSWQLEFSLNVSYLHFAMKWGWDLSVHWDISIYEAE